VGNERLTALVGLTLLTLSVVELATIVLGLHRFLSLHVFVGLVLIPPIALKLASTGWRFTRYYTGNRAYRLRGAPRLVMRMLAPLLVVATIVLFGSGVAMGLLHGQQLEVARRLHGPASAIWLLLVGVHVLVHLRRALARGREDVRRPSRRSVPGARKRTLVLAAAIAVGIGVGAAMLPVQHDWLHLPRRHDQGEDGAGASRSRRLSPERPPAATEALAGSVRAPGSER
jgi:succinate dehydrogenase hydrophobic anchor subunit